MLTVIKSYVFKIKLLNNGRSKNLTLLLCDLFGKHSKLLYNILAIKLFKSFDKITKNNIVEY